MRKAAKREPSAWLGLYHVLLLAVLFAVWYALTTPGLVSEDFAKNTAFFFGKPLQVLKVIWEWFTSGKIYPHLGVTLLETLLAFVRRQPPRFGHRALARAVADRVRARRSLHHGAQRDAARDPRADLRRLVRARHRVQSRARRDARLLHRLLQRLPGREGSRSVGAGQCANARRVTPPVAAPHLSAVGDVVGVLEPSHLGGDGVRRRGRRRVPRARRRAWAT